MKILKITSENWVEKVLAAAVLLALLPILYTCVRCNFMSDDFYELCNFRRFDGNIFIAAFAYARYVYQTWLGTYFSIFLIILSPLNIGNVQWLRVMMTFCTILFVIAFFLFTKSVVQYLGWKNNVARMLAGLVLFILFFCNAYPQVFYWFSGSTVYLMPVELGLLGIAGMIYAEKKHSRLLLVFSCVGVFCMSGGALQGAGLGCYLILLLLVHQTLREKKVSLYYGAVFIVAVVGALINTLAPGNYVRHAEMGDTKLHFLPMFLNSIKIVVKQMADFCSNPFYLVFLIGILLIGIKCIPSFSKGILYFLLTVVSVFAIPVVCAYPVVLAYNASGIVYFANRNHFLLDFSILLSFCGIMLLLGMQIQKCKYFRFGRNFIVFSGLISGIILILNFSAIRDQAGIYMWYNVLNGKIKEHYKLVEAMYEKIENSPEEDVLINQSELTTVPRGCYYDAVVVDPEAWTNKAIAEFYGKKTVRLSEE